MEPQDNDNTDWEVALGKRLVTRARSWIREHPDGWLSFRAACAAAQRRYGSVSRDQVYTVLRDRRVDLTDRKGIARAHDLFSALVRYAQAEDPGLVVKRGRCSIDKAYPDGLPEI